MDIVVIAIPDGSNVAIAVAVVVTFVIAIANGSNIPVAVFF